MDKRYIAIIAKKDCFKVKNSQEWYLPHHHVIQQQKPGEVRRLLMGAANYQNHSLKNASLTAPDLLQSLFHILIRF